MWTNTVSNVGQQGSVIPGSGLDELANQSEPHANVEQWPFVVRLANSSDDIERAAALRFAAYSRHLPPSICASFKKPEKLDSLPGCYILLAESKIDGSVLGTMRIQSDSHYPVMLQRATLLPSWMQGRKLAEATRLAVDNISASMVKAALIKAGYQLCLKVNIDYLVIAARMPADRMYTRLLFSDVYTDGRMIPLDYAFNLPHRILFSDIKNARNQWEAANHPMLDFMTKTVHPDLQIDA